MAVSNIDADLNETIDRARQQTDQLNEYNHSFEVLGYGVLDRERLGDEYRALVPPEEADAVEMLEKQSREVAEQWIETHETVERELLYLFPEYETSVHEMIVGETDPEKIRESFGVEPDMNTYRDNVEQVLQINNDYRILEHRIEDLSRSLEREDYPSPREIRMEQDRWYSNHRERLEQLEFVQASQLEADEP